MQAEVGDDALDTAGAEGVAGLAELLGHHRRTGIRIQKAVADDLLADLFGAAVGGFGAAFLALQGQGAPAQEGLAELEVTGFAEAELAGGGQRARAFAFAFVEHGQFEGDFVVGRDGEGAGGALQRLGKGVRIEFQHERRVGDGGRIV